MPFQLPSARVDQLGFLVPDLSAAVDTWTAALDVDNWRVYTYSPEWTNIELTYRGQPGKFAMRLALVDTVPQIELIQPLQGPSIYHDWIAQHGFGLHHIGFFVSSIAESVALHRRNGSEPAQTGNGYGVDGDGGFAYYETDNEFGTVVELIEAPSQRRPSETL